MFTSILLALALIISPASAPERVATSAPVVEQAEIVDLNIQITDDEDVEREAWASLDALTPEELEEYALGSMRVTFIGTTEDAFATHSMFSLETPEVTYVFSKTDTESYSDVRLDSLPQVEQDNLTQNLPDCDEDIIKSCINESVTTVTF